MVSDGTNLSSLHNGRGEVEYREMVVMLMVELLSIGDDVGGDGGDDIQSIFFYLAKNNDFVTRSC